MMQTRLTQQPGLEIACCLDAGVAISIVRWPICGECATMKSAPIARFSHLWAVERWALGHSDTRHMVLCNQHRTPSGVENRALFELFRLVNRGWRTHPPVPFHRHQTSLRWAGLNRPVETGRVPTVPVGFCYASSLCLQMAAMLARSKLRNWGRFHKGEAIQIESGSCPW